MLNPAKRVPAYVRYGRLGWITQSTRPFIMRRYWKLPKLLYFSGIVEQHPTGSAKGSRECVEHWEYTNDGAVRSATVNPAGTMEAVDAAALV